MPLPLLGAVSGTSYVLPLPLKVPKEPDETEISPRVKPDTESLKEISIVVVSPTDKDELRGVSVTVRRDDAGGGGGGVTLSSLSSFSGGV